MQCGALETTSFSGAVTGMRTPHVKNPTTEVANTISDAAEDPIALPLSLCRPAMSCWGPWASPCCVVWKGEGGY